MCGEHLELRWHALRQGGAHQSLRRAGCQRNIVPAVKAQFFPGQTATADCIVGYGGNRPDIQFGRLQR